MFEGMGIQWASTLLGCVAFLLVPIPIAFYKWGHILRAKSKFAPTLPSAPPAADDGEDSHANGADAEKSDTSAAGSIRRKDEAAAGGGV